MKLLIPSMTGAIIMSIYSFIDTIAVGQSEGVFGAGAMAVIAPVYGVMVFMSILCGIGGSVMMSVARGEGNDEKGNACFTAAVILMSLITLISWVLLLVFKVPVLRFFGANDDVLPKALEYGNWIIGMMPVFVFSVFMPAFIRNDGAPELAMKAVVIGGCVNIFGDWFLVFPMKMGMTGAALATTIGTTIQTIIIASYFFTSRCRLKLKRPHHYIRGFIRILRIGLGASALDLGSVIIPIMINNRILKYGSTTELAIFGVLITIMTLFQALFCGVGQAVQPLVSTNYGARQAERIRSFWKMALKTTLGLGILFTAIGELLPKQITAMFMDPAEDVLLKVPDAFRLFFTVFIFLGITVLSAYYLQSMVKEKESLIIGILHSFLLSGLVCLILPAILGIRGVWLTLPVTEMIIAAGALIYISRRDFL